MDVLRKGRNSAVDYLASTGIPAAVDYVSREVIEPSANRDKLIKAQRKGSMADFANPIKDLWKPVTDFSRKRWEPFRKDVADYGLLAPFIAPARASEHIINDAVTTGKNMFGGLTTIDTELKQLAGGSGESAKASGVTDAQKQAPPKGKAYVPPKSAPAAQPSEYFDKGGVSYRAFPNAKALDKRVEFGNGNYIASEHLTPEKAARMAQHLREGSPTGPKDPVYPTYQPPVYQQAAPQGLTMQDMLDMMPEQRGDLTRAENARIRRQQNIMMKLFANQPNPAQGKAADPLGAYKKQLEVMNLQQQMGINADTARRNAIKDHNEVAKYKNRYAQDTQKNRQAAFKSNLDLAKAIYGDDLATAFVKSVGRGDKLLKDRGFPVRAADMDADQFNALMQLFAPEYQAVKESNTPWIGYADPITTEQLDNIWTRMFSKKANPAVQ